jgi:hypothetical protein
VQQQRQQQQARELQEARQSLASRLAASDLITQPLQLKGRELKGECWAHTRYGECTTGIYPPPPKLACTGACLALLLATAPMCYVWQLLALRSWRPGCACTPCMTAARHLPCFGPKQQMPN